MPSADAAPPVALLYRARALEMAHSIRTDWATRPHQDLKALLDEVQSAFAEEANHQLRQVLFQLSAQLELAFVKGSGGTATLSRDEGLRLLGALHRTTSIVEAYLDRSEAAKLVLDIQTAPFDVGDTLHRLLGWNGLLDDPRTDVRIDPVTIDGDEDHLMDILGHMVNRFHFQRADEERVRITLLDQGDRVEGFFGLSGAGYTALDLVAEFEKPLEMDDMRIDMPYARAVIERHGGTLFVAAAEDAIGYGFILPRRQPTGDH